jgi:peptidoglycan hydrolase CwlO-like protein
MILKWTTESVIAAVAVAITSAGALYNSSYHWGQVNQQIEELKGRTGNVETHIAKHDDQLTEIKQQNAGIQQSLNDIKDTVRDIQLQVRKPQHGDNK